MGTTLIFRSSERNRSMDAPRKERKKSPGSRGEKGGENL